MSKHQKKKKFFFIIFFFFFFLLFDPFLSSIGEVSPTRMENKVKLVICQGSGSHSIYGIISRNKPLSTLSSYYLAYYKGIMWLCREMYIVRHGEIVKCL